MTRFEAKLKMSMNIRCQGVYEHTRVQKALVWKQHASALVSSLCDMQSCVVVQMPEAIPCESQGSALQALYFLT